MEKWIKITESNFQLFQTNEDFLLFISLLRLCDADGEVDTSLSKVMSVSRLSSDEVRDSMCHLCNQGLVSDNIEGDVLHTNIMVRKGAWWGGDVKKVKPVEQLSGIELRFRERLKEKFPRIARMEKPLLLSEYYEIRKYYTDKQIQAKMLAMQNKRSLTREWSDAKLTLLTWLGNEYGKK